MDEVIKLLRERVVLCGQLIKLFTEWIDLLKNNSSDTIELVTKISAIIKTRINITKRLSLSIKNKFGKNAILRGMSLEKKATAKIRNKLVGGHNGE